MAWETKGAWLCNQKDSFISSLLQLSLNFSPFFAKLFIFFPKWKKVGKKDQSFRYQNDFLLLALQKYIHINILSRRLYKRMSCFHYLLEQHLRNTNFVKNHLHKKVIFMCVLQIPPMLLL